MYIATSPEEQLKMDWIASAHYMREGLHTEGEERWRCSNHRNPTPVGQRAVGRDITNKPMCRLTCPGAQ